MVNLFENISLKNQEKLIKLLRGYTVNYHRNQAITDLFKDDDEIGLIVSGNVKIIQNNYNGTSTTMGDFYDNDLIGSMLLYINNVETKIIAKEETQMIIFSYHEIMNQEINDKSYNQFIKNLLDIIKWNMTEKSERIKMLTNKTIRNKLLEYFNINSRKSGSRYIYLPFNFSDLASYLAIDRSAMSREIGYLKEEGFIEIKGKRITLLYR